MGPYEILDAIGAGGMGEVYRARDTRLERTVAIKVLPQHLAHTSEARQRFEREARAVSSLNHPHICVLHDVGSQDGTEYLVMEYLEGETLSARLEKGPLPLDVVLRYGVEIADALDKAHRQGIIHRDLKPGNIMLTKSGAKLLDFGVDAEKRDGDRVNDAVEEEAVEDFLRLVLVEEVLAGEAREHYSEIGDEAGPDEQRPHGQERRQEGSRDADQRSHDRPSQRHGEAAAAGVFSSLFIERAEELRLRVRHGFSCSLGMSRGKPTYNPVLREVN